MLLGVNVDHVATLRQARGTVYPDPVDAALLAERAGADSITVHLREDRRHIQDHDVERLQQRTHSRVNLEIALLRQRRDDQDDPPEPPEPSPFAERLKAQADSLVAIWQYEDAFGLMQQGLVRDSTVAAFGEYIQRLGDIVRIDTTGTP